MAAPNYAAYDGPNDDELSLSEAAHLWVEMVPPPERDGQHFPGLPGTGWKRDFWRWLKRHIRRRLELRLVPKGHQQFPRSLYLEIATSEEYAVLVEAFPALKPRPLFLFPEERGGEVPSTDHEEKNNSDDGRLLLYPGPRPNIETLPNLQNDTGGNVKPATKKQYYEWLACARWRINDNPNRDAATIAAEITNSFIEKGGRTIKAETITRKLNAHFPGWKDPDSFQLENWIDPAP